MVLAKEKNDEKALEYLIRSVHKYTMNWGCWLEMTSLISRVEDVSYHDGISSFGTDSI
jgi:anaphase-promoting complex subunit 8